MKTRWNRLGMIVSLLVLLQATSLRAAVTFSTREVAPPPACQAYLAGDNVDACKECHYVAEASTSQALNASGAMAAVSMMASISSATTTVTSPDGKFTITYPPEVGLGESFTNNVTVWGYAMMYYNFLDSVLNWSTWPWFSFNRTYAHAGVFDQPGTHTYKSQVLYCGNGSAVCGHGWMSTDISWDVAVGSSCDVAISGFGASTDTINTGAGDEVNFTGTITSSQPVDWSIDIVSSDLVPATVASTSGSGSQVGPWPWNGTDQESFPYTNFVSSGYYLATITATSSASCFAQATVVIAVDPATVCSMNVSAGSSVNIGSGALSFSQDLFNARGGALPAGLDLSYQGLSGYNGSLGRNWTHGYDVYVRPAGNDSMLLHESAGQWKLLVRSGDVYMPRTSTYPILRRNADGTSILEEKSGLLYYFDAAGSAQSLVDRNGNTLSFAFDADGRLASVTDPAGRITTLGYDANGRIGTVTAPDGQVYTLSYTGDLLASVVFPDRSTWSYAYDASLNLTSKTDPLGHTTRYEYDGAGRLVRSVDPEGNGRSLNYSLASGLTVLTEKDGGLWTYRYDTHLGVPTSKIDPQGNTRSYVYDASRNLLAETDPRGGVTRYTYDGAGNMLTVTDAAGQGTTYTYNALNLIASITDPEGKTTNFVYDEHANRTATTDALGATMRQEFDARGNIVRRTTALGAATAFTYDTAGNPASVTDPAGIVTTLVYDLMGNMIRITDATGAATTFTYDSRGRLLSTTGPEGGTVTTVYDSNGNRTSQTDQKGSTTRFEYDANGRLARMIDPAGGATTYTYGSSGCPSCAAGIDRLVSITDANGHTTHYEYDLLGRRIAEVDALGNRVTSAYDAAGNLISKTNPEGRTTTYSYDVLSRRTSVIDPLGGQIATTYTPEGRTGSVTDPVGVTTSYEYDAGGRIIRTTSPDSGVVLQSYNADGTLASRTDANGTVVSYLYDAAGRVTRISYPDPTQDVVFGYDAATSENGKGRLASMTDRSGTTTYHYDQAGRITREVRTVLGVSYTTRFAYDAAGILTEITYPSGRAVSVMLDVRDRPTAVTGTLGTSQALLSGATYDAAGNPLTMALGNGLVATLGYDEANRLATIAIPGITSLVYIYDRAGNILAISDGLHAESSKSYAYDLLDRLIDSTGPWGTLSWSYDGNGNRLTQDDGTNPVTYLYAGNRLASVTDDVTQLSQYDAAGNTTSDGWRSFVYDQNQRLMQVKINGTLAGQYIYDGRGRRVIKHTGPAALGSSTPQNVVYHYDLAGRLIEETATDGKLLVDYVYLEGKPLAMIRKQSAGEETFYYHDDHLGSPILMTDKNGNIVWNVALEPFGNAVPYKGRHGDFVRNVVNNLRFPGQYYDAESGLHQNWHRDYDPKLGRYVEADPAGLRGDQNIFAYGKDNPVLGIDVLGLASCPPSGVVRFFTWLCKPLKQMSADLNTNGDFLYALAAKEGGWTEQDLNHNMPLNNPFGVNRIVKGKAAGNIHYRSLDDAIADWKVNGAVIAWGDRVSGSQAATDFINNLQCVNMNCPKYNSANPNYIADYMAVYQSVLKYKPACGCE